MQMAEVGRDLWARFCQRMASNPPTLPCRGAAAEEVGFQLSVRDLSLGERYAAA